MAAMLAKWAPPLERSKMATFIFAGKECIVELIMMYSLYCALIYLSFAFILIL